MINAKDLVSKLTDVFNKNPLSNISKIFVIVSEQFQKIEETLHQIEDYHDIEKAEGVTLDYIGSNVGQARGTADDPVYRLLIRSRIARNLSQGTVDSIIEVLSISLDCSASEINIKELPYDPITKEPAAIGLIAVPLEKLHMIGMDLTDFIRVVQKTVSAGVRVGKIEFSGTFEFGTTTIERSSFGFANIEKTIGGTLGKIFIIDKESRLPL